MSKTLYEVSTGEKPPMGLSADDKLLLERIENDFGYVAPNGERAQKHVEMRRAAQTLARLVVEACPSSRERSMALTKLEEAAMWAHAAIAKGSL